HWPGSRRSTALGANQASTFSHPEGAPTGKGAALGSNQRRHTCQYKRNRNCIQHETVHGRQRSRQDGALDHERMVTKIVNKRGSLHPLTLNEKTQLRLGFHSSGGEPGVRTLCTVASTTDFESVPFDHSGNSPGRRA